MPRPIRFPYVTIGLMATLVLAHIATMASGIAVDYDGYALARHWVYLTPQEVWSGGYWTLLTGSFVHVSPLPMVADLYLLFDLGALWFLGRRVEGALGPSAMFGLMFFGAIASSAAGIAAGALPALGASGMICALIGAMQAGRRRHFLFAEVFLVRENARLLLSWMLTIFLASMAGAIAVSNAAHAAGWCFGYCASQVFFIKKPRPSAVLGLIAIAALSLTALHWNPWLPQWVVWKFSQEARAGRVQAGLDLLEPMLKSDPPNPDALNAAAWVMATSRHEAARDGKQAIVMARQACALTQLLEPSYIDTLAAAYAEDGDFDKAQAMEEQAIDVAKFLKAPPELIEIFTQNQKTLTSRKKIRE